MHLTASLARRLGWDSVKKPTGELDIPDEPQAIADDDLVQLRERCAFTETPPLTSRLPVAYTRVPGWARTAIASAIGRRKRRQAHEWATFPGWPIDLSVDALDDLRGRARPWRSGPTPVVLTHDVDSPEGLRNLVERFLPLEEGFGARTTNYVVPCGWKVDGALMTEIVRRGHTVGVHGYDHSNRTAFADPDERRRRLNAARPFAEAYGASGYRSPSLWRTRALLHDVGRAFSYDSSIPTAGGPFPAPNNGCATARPFSVEGCIELPISLPRDGSLRFLGYTPDETAATWKECADLVNASGGVVVLLTHCERRFSGNPSMLAAYRAFLEHVVARPDRFVFSDPAAVLGTARADARDTPGRDVHRPAPL